jgi:hypothetical protein
VKEEAPLFLVVEVIRPFPRANRQKARVMRILQDYRHLVVSDTRLHGLAEATEAAFFDGHAAFASRVMSVAQSSTIWGTCFNRAASSVGNCY